MWGFVYIFRDAFGRGAGAPSFCVGFQLKSKFPATLILFLAPVSIRQLPLASATYTCAGFVDIFRDALGRGRRRPKFLSRILDKIAIPISAYHIFSFIRPPSASAGFRQIYMCGFIRQISRGMWTGARFLKPQGRIFLKSKFAVLLIQVVASVSFLQLPRTSAMVRHIYMCGILDTNAKWRFGGESVHSSCVEI